MTEGAAQTISQRIKEKRHALGLTPLQFAERTGVCLVRIRELESGKRVLKNGVELLKIAESCNCHYSDLFTRKDDTLIRLNASFPENFSDVVKKKIGEKGWNRKEVSRMLGVSQSTLSIWLSGNYSPTVFAFQNIVNLLGIRSYDFANSSNMSIGGGQLQTEVQEKNENAAVEVPAKTETHASPLTEAEKQFIKAVTMYSNIREQIQKLNEIIDNATKMRDFLEKLL